jgi:hypothetical protein
MRYQRRRLASILSINSEAIGLFLNQKSLCGGENVISLPKLLALRSVNVTRGEFGSTRIINLIAQA